MHPQRAFTLIEVLVVIAIIAIIAALLFPVLSEAKARAQRAMCINNLHQINLGIHMYLDDNNGSPGNTNMMHLPFVNWTGYRQLINNDVGINGASSPQDRLFACPADSFFYDLSRGGQGYVAKPLHEQTNQAFTSYAYNAGQFSSPQTSNSPAITNYYGIAGQRLELIRHPSKTVLVAEVPAFWPYSWHQPKLPFSNKTRSLLMPKTSFVSWTVTLITSKSISTAKRSRGITIRPPGTITNGAAIKILVKK